ncbi:MAG: metallophosphoesterase [Niabella sp.]
MQKAILFLFLFITLNTIAQDDVANRIILIGDAGEMDAQQKNVLTEAANKILDNKTTVIFLGDNIYPDGMALSGSRVPETQEIIRSQFEPMRAKGAPVYFVPGNHDWDRMGRDGLQKMKKQWQFIEDQNDDQLKVIPANGCPDPVEIKVSDHLVIIAYDSEWWLFPYDKKNEGADCDCKTEQDVVARLNELFYRNRDKTILLASHHPFKSYGTHGGYFSLKDHLFPLTVINKNLYIPLPVIGSLYPLLRSTLTSPEDLKDPVYKNLIKQVGSVFKGFPNIIYAAGHEHGLQLIKSDRLQIVSGAGAKENYTKKGKYSLYGAMLPGFVTVDELKNKDTRINYYSYDGKHISNAYTYTQPYTPVSYPTDKLADAFNTDSVTVRVHPAYDNKSKFHRFLFGEGYRKEWAAPTTLPVFKISEMMDGLAPTKRGGGMQSLSLRLEDKKGKEYVIRTVEKVPDALLPEALRQTFAKDFVDDVTSLQHPFSALVVPPIAQATGVPHTTPVIGVVAPDTALGLNEKTFAGKIVLFEEREPLGKSDNTEKMLSKLNSDNDDSYNAKEFLKARMLDVLLGDWDRHEDQWRWFDGKKGKNRYYLSVPRDRDQVFHLTEGVLPKIASKPWILPTYQNFGPEIESYKYSLIKSDFLNAHPATQFTYTEWMQTVNEFTAAVTDEALEKGLQRLPASAYNIRHNRLLASLKQRRDQLPEAMQRYYNFINKKLDIKASDKNEQVTVKGTPEGNLRVMLQKINKDGQLKDTLMDKVYDARLTREINIYTGEGDDKITVDNNTSRIKMRIIGGAGNKEYNVNAAKRKIKVFDGRSNAVFNGAVNRLQKHLSNDSLNTAFIPVNLYNVTMPLITGGYNLDDGLILGLGIKYTHQGFRKQPYASMQQLTVAHAFSTSAFRIKYKGAFIHTFGNADLVIDAQAKAPNNTQNFFGRGNESNFNKTGDWKRYYRTRFSLYTFDPALRWRGSKTSSVSIGPSFQYYGFDADDNTGRFINNASLIGSYDSTTINKEKLHAGIAANFINDNRNNKIFPSYGSYISIKLQGYEGLNGYSKAYGQILPEFSFYKNIDPHASLILANRVGGVVTIGHTTFYQSAFLGGHENLLGYRQYRFAGQHSFYNNTELRLKLANVASYILPGQLGLTGFFDVGRVWEKNDSSEKWHNGAGGGIYFAPAQIAVFQFVMGHSSEGWYPYFTMGFRF